MQTQLTRLTISALHVITGLDRAELAARAYAEGWPVARGHHPRARCPRQFSVEGLPQDIRTDIEIWTTAREARKRPLAAPALPRAVRTRAKMAAGRPCSPDDRVAAKLLRIIGGAA